MFADMMIQMHSMSNTAAQALGVVGQPSAVQSDLDANGKTTLSQLAPLSGAAFDLAYMQAQVMAHMTVKTIIETQLIPSATNADLKNFLQSTLLPTVEAHLSGATALLASLEDGGLPDARADGSADASADASDASAE
jgi:putative membrane protein